jgi:hypothetical protein
MTATIPQPTSAAGPEKRASRLNPVVLGCLVLPAVLLVLGVLGAAVGWRKFVSYGIATDLTEYQAKIRPMDLDPAVKKPLLERLERLRDKARASPISFWRWIDYDESLQSLLEDERLTQDEVEALNRELDRMEAEFR